MPHSVWSFVKLEWERQSQWKFMWSKVILSSSHFGKGHRETIIFLCHRHMYCTYIALCITLWETTLTIKCKNLHKTFKKAITRFQSLSLSSTIGRHPCLYINVPMIFNVLPTPTFWCLGDTISIDPLYECISLLTWDLWFVKSLHIYGPNIRR